MGREFKRGMKGGSMTFGEYLLSITTKEELKYLEEKGKKCDCVKNVKNTKPAKNSVQKPKPM